MSSFVKHMMLVLAQVLLLVSTFSVVSEAWRTMMHERIINMLGPGVNLSAHCKSGDDDLGIHVLRYNESFSWEFRPNMWGTTLFYCYFWWTGHEIAVDMYKDGMCLDKCYWTVSKTGICLGEQHWPHKNFCYAWE